jgi:methyl-accepting chemotaxis protein
VFAQWGFSYLFKRFETQLFMVFTSVTLVIFLVTTISFTALLLKNIEKNTYSSLEDDSKMLLFTIESKTAETLSDAQVLSGNPDMETLLSQEDRRPLKSLTENFLLSKKESSLAVLDSKGIVLARGEDRERVGDSFSSDPIIKSALLGKDITSLVTKEGALAPLVQIVAASPIKSKEGGVIGVVVAVNTIDHTFLDRVKTATGFEVGIYGGEYLSTTSVKPFINSNERAIGIKESNQEVKDRVLAKGEEFVGHVDFLSSQYMASYLPLKDSDNTVIGMLFVGTPEVALLQTASRSIEITFIETVVLLVLSVVPSYLISRSISKQL